MNSMQVYETVPDIQSKVQYSLLTTFVMSVVWGSAEVSKIQIWFKPGQSVRLHVIFCCCEMLKSFLLMHDHDITFEELRP